MCFEFFGNFLSVNYKFVVDIWDISQWYCDMVLDYSSADLCEFSRTPQKFPNSRFDKLLAYLNVVWWHTLHRYHRQRISSR